MSAMLPAEDNLLAAGSLLTSASSNYQVQSLVGKGTFGKVVRCQRLVDKKTVAIKIIKRPATAFHAMMADKEVAILKKLRLLDPDNCNLVQWHQEFFDRGHMCLEFEHLDQNLLDFMKERWFRPLLLKEIRPFVQQIANALNHLKAAGIIHADLKLDNVMLVNQLQEPFRIKLIDFGLACEVSAAKLGSYIQTRPYRSPEIILGHTFTEAIDMWSLGCLTAALYLGALLYPGLGEYEMVKYILETQGQLPDTMMNRGRRTHLFFNRDVTSTTSIWKLKTPKEYLTKTGKRPMENRSLKFNSLDDLLHIQHNFSCNDTDKAAEMKDVLMFVDMLKGMLHLDPDKRLTPSQVLEHDFISMRHIAGMDQYSNYVRSCFQLMEICQKQTQPRQTRETDGSRWRKIDYEDVLPHKTNCLHWSDSSRRLQENHDDSSNREDMRERGRYDMADRSTCSSKHASLHTRNHQSDQRTGPADHHRHPHSTWIESQAQSGPKSQRGDHEDVRPHKTNSTHWSDSSRGLQGNREYSRSRSREDMRKRGRYDMAD